jgi:S1-C subfamily serine protease
MTSRLKVLPIARGTALAVLFSNFAAGPLSCLFSTQAAPVSAVRRDETVRAVERVMPSVVNISTKTVTKRRGFLYDWWRDNWAPFYQELPPQYSAGSGVIVDDEGYIITNVHVVEDATEIVVTLADKRNYPAHLVAGAPKSDIALLKIEGKPGEKFVPIQFAADDDLLLGETVIALGNPFALGGSVSKGILSSKTRRSTAQDGVLDMEDWIQTDAAINPGNSGGPLVNLDGNLIGLNVAIFKEGQGIGFAIPVKRISEALGQIFTPETLRSLWLGAQFQSTTNGLKVASVEKGSPAEKGGLREEDVVTQLNSITPQSVFALNREMIASSSRNLVFQLRRDGVPRTASVKLLPEQSHYNTKLIREKIGLSVRQLTSNEIARLGLDINSGFVVTDIERGSPADNAGFQRGLIVEGVNGNPSASITVLARAIGSRKRGQPVQLNVIVPGPFRRADVQLKVR